MNVVDFIRKYGWEDAFEALNIANTELSHVTYKGHTLYIKDLFKYVYAKIKVDQSLENSNSPKSDKSIEVLDKAKILVKECEMQENTKYSDGEDITLLRRHLFNLFIEVTFSPSNSKFWLWITEENEDCDTIEVQEHVMRLDSIDEVTYEIHRLMLLQYQELTQRKSLFILDSIEQIKKRITSEYIKNVLES